MQEGQLKTKFRVAIRDFGKSIIDHAHISISDYNLKLQTFGPLAARSSTYWSGEVSWTLYVGAKEVSPAKQLDVMLTLYAVELSRDLLSVAATY